MAGQVFQQFRRDIHVRSLPVEDGFFRQVFGGLDFGGVSPTALIAGGLDGAGRAWAFGEFYKHECTFDQLVEAMAGMEEQHGAWLETSKRRILRWIADPSGKEEIQKLRNVGFDVVPASHGNKIPLRVQLVGARLNISPETKLPGCYFTPEVPNLIMEIEGLAWRRHRLQGRVDEQLTDNFDRSCPDHSFDAWANILSSWDAVRSPFRMPKGVARVYGGIAG